MLRWSSLLVVLAGLWTALAPFVGPALGVGNTSPMPAMSGGMQHSMAGPAIMFTATTLWYHVLPGALAIVVGLYQLVAPSWLASRARAADRQPQQQAHHRHLGATS